MERRGLVCVIPEGGPCWFFSFAVVWRGYSVVFSMGCKRRGPLVGLLDRGINP